MGNRISLQFVNKKDKSVVLFSQRDGIKIVKEANKFVKGLDEINSSNPFSRREPNTIMINFILKYIKKYPVDSNYYLGKNENNGDNSDNGHFKIKL